MDRFEKALEMRDELIDELFDAVRDCILSDEINESWLRDIANNLFFAGYNCDD